MNSPLRFLYLTVIVQVLLTSVITYYLVTDEYRKLSSESLKTLESFFYQQKKQELKNYTALATAAVKHLSLTGEANSQLQKDKVADILNLMLYDGDDGYFFIYDETGTNISHPKESFRVGKNWWELENRGEKIIQILIKNAQAGGDFYQYHWSKPSSGVLSEKMSYSIYLEDLNWMLGTGIYLDDVNNQLKKLQLEIDQHISKTKQIILVVALSSLALLFLFGTYIYFKQKRKNDITINKLGQRIINLQEEERRHISRNLHDGIVQILISIKYSLEATGLLLKKQQQQKPKSLLQAEQNLSTAIQEIRRISHHLHPRVLDELGLSSAIDALAKEFSERTGLQVKIITPAVRKILPDNISSSLYRMVQESLTNIEKHAQASNVKIEMTLERKWLTLKVADDGVGFKTRKQLREKDFGIGLRNLAERIEYHNGHFTYSSSTAGTIIVAQIPTVGFASYFNSTSSGFEQNQAKLNMTDSSEGKL
ncbi:cache domain-containing protein [Gammaproteobacteria bacterium AS21]